MPEITSEADLQAALRNITRTVIQNVTVQVLQKLKQRIEEDTLAGHEVLWYTRTGQFENAWLWSDISETIDTMEAELTYHPELVIHNPEMWQHGNPFESAVETLMEILDVDGRTSDLMFGGKYFSPERKAYWQNFIKEMYDNGELEQMFNSEFSKNGMIIE